MRYVHIALIAVLAGLVLLFMLQNLPSVTVTLFSISLTMPLSLLIFLVYVLGMLTGGLVLQFTRGLVRGAARPPS